MSYTSVILADQPQAYYRLNEIGGTTAFDATSNHYDATLVGNVSFSQPGAIVGDPDTALFFNATDTLALPYTLNYTTWSAFSLEFWITLDQVTWQYVVVTCNKPNTALYLQAVPTSSVAGNPIEISSIFDWAGSSLSGSLDEVALYSYVLTGSQIQSHYTISQLGLVSGSRYVAANGAALSTQPNILTTPHPLPGEGSLLEKGSRFVHIFDNPTPAVQSLMVNGATMSLTFPLDSGLLVTAQVQVASTLLGGTNFQVTYTLLQTLKLSANSLIPHYLPI